MELSENMRFKRAKKRVEALKGFYIHLIVYISVNVFLLIVRGNVIGFVINVSPDKNFLEWVDWNILVVPVFWGIGLLFHAAKVFKYKLNFIKNWEERQLLKFMKEEESQRNKFS